MKEAYTLEINATTHDYSLKRAIGLLKISAHDGMHIPFTKEEESIWCDFVGTYTAIYDKISPHKNKEEQKVISMYALHTAATYILRTRNLNTDHDCTTTIQFEGDIREERIRNIFKNTLDTYLSSPSTQRQAYLGSLLKQSANKASRAAKDYASIATKYQQTKIKINNTILTSFLQETTQVIEPSYLAERVVGNEQMMLGLKRALHALAHFNGDTNPLLNYMKIPKTVNIHGPPGCGKTMGIRQAYHDAKTQYEPHMTVPMHMITLSNKFKSSLFSESSERLRELFRKANDGKAAYVIVADDIESIFHDRRNLDNNPEEKNIMNTLLNELEGLLVNERGNYLLISTSNFPLQIDPALNQRLSELVLSATGPQTPNQYATLFKNKFAKGIDVGYVAVDNWQEIGKIAAQIRFPGRHASTLSGRHIKDIVATINNNYVLPILPNKILTTKQLDKILSTPIVTQETIQTQIKQFAHDHEAFLDDILAV